MKRCVWKSLLFLVLSVAHCGIWAADDAYFQSELRVPPLGAGPDVWITLVIPESARGAFTDIVTNTKEAARIVQERMGASFKDDFYIFFDPRPDFHNGLTTVIPNNRISVHLEAPELESTIGLSRHYFLETLIHEMSHMIVTQQRSGVFSALDIFLGNASRPLGAWPRWMHEGLAVWSEGAAGGRPQSGYIEFDLRRYADFFERTKRHPLSDSDLDGASSIYYVEPGTIPYHFGYLLMDAWWEKRNRSPWQALLSSYAESPGLSFRINFRNDFHESLESFFASQRDKWSKYPLKETSALPGKEIARAPHIRGPFAFRLRSSRGSLFHSLSWLEGDLTKGSPLVIRGRLDEGLIRTTKMRMSFARPSQAFLLEDSFLVLFAQLPRISEERALSGADFSRKQLGIIDFAGHFRCQFLKFPDRVREIALFENQIGWIRTDDDGVRQIVERARYNQNCELNSVREVARSQKPFERLSGLSIDEASEVFSRALFHEPFEAVEWNGNVIEASFPLSEAYVWSDHLVAHGFSKDAFAPIYISEIHADAKSGAQAQGFKLPVRTGALRSSTGSLLPPELGGYLVVKESLWENDRLVAVYPGEFSLPEVVRVNKIPNSIEATSTAPVASVDPGQKDITTQNYAAWPSLWPHFWLPTLIAYSGGYTFFGQTFYSDLTDNWSGASALGYDSYTERPFFSTSLSKKGFAGGPFSQVNGLIYYAPSAFETSFGKSVFDRSGAELSLDSSYAFRNLGVRSNTTFSLRYELGRSDGSLKDFSYFAPAVFLGVSTKAALNSQSPNFRLADAGTGVLASFKLKRIFAPEYLAVLQGVTGFRRLGFSARAEYAHTDIKNYPASYFEFGGLYTFGTSISSFMTRGFVPRLGIAKEVIRGEAQIGFPLVFLKQSLSWNRFRLGQVDQRIVAETVTFAPFAGARFALGHGYFSTLGTEMDIFGSVVQYLNYTATLGYYHGFGPYGENRVALRVTSYLDL